MLVLGSVTRSLFFGFLFGKTSPSPLSKHEIQRGVQEGKFEKKMKVVSPEQ